MSAERRRKLNLPDGREVEAIEQTFRSAGENWNEYLVDDGTVIKVKLVATEILKLDGEFDPAGQPIYLVGSTNVMAVSAPENLRRKDGEQ